MAIQVGKVRPSQLFVREWLKAKGVTQEKLAELMGRAPGIISKLLKGEMEMTTDYLGDIADALDVSAIDLFTDPFSGGGALAAEARLIADIYLRLTPEGRASTLSLLRQLPPAQSAELG